MSVHKNKLISWKRGLLQREDNRRVSFCVNIGINYSISLGAVTKGRVLEKI